MFEPIRIAPSILSADFMNLGRDVALVERAGAGFVHIDVMDGHFVPNLTMGIPVVRRLKRATALPLDVHLMISNPVDELPWFLEAGADVVTMHVEAFGSSDAMAAALETVREAGAKAALGIRPKTPVYALAEVIDLLDMVLVMSVEPGFSGQPFVEGSESKVATVVELARASGAAPLVEVDGGISAATAPRMAAAGADVLVCGNAVFSTADPAAAVAEIAAAAEGARAEALAAGAADAHPGEVL